MASDYSKVSVTAFPHVCSIQSLAGFPVPNLPLSIVDSKSGMQVVAICLKSQCIYITVYIEVLFFLIFFVACKQYRRWRDISQDGDSVAWDGGVSSMAGLNLGCGHTPTRRR